MFAILVFSTSAFAIDISNLDPKKLTVCSITINSDDEIKTFQQKLPTKDFQFVELASHKKSATAQENDWFGDACSSGVQCDLLVVSGHFGGVFFGKSGLSLPLEQIEKHSCAQDCKGVLQRPREVFLFGCNTLATKDRDARTPEQYLQILLQDGIDRETAERVVESRYGMIGDSNRARMRRAFDGVPHLYGFSSVGPLGATSKPFLEKYFQEKGDYAQYLAQDTAQKLVSDVDSLNQGAPAPGNANDLLQKEMQTTSFYQCPGITPDDPDFEAKSDLCFLYDDQNSEQNKLEKIYEITQRKDFLAFLPAIEDFFLLHNPVLNASGSEKETLEKIQNNSAFKNTVQTLASQLKTPTMRSELLGFQHDAGWISSEQYASEMKETVQKLLTPPLTDEKADVLCSLSDKRQSAIESLHLTMKDLDPSLFSSAISPFTIVTIGCTRSVDPNVQMAVIKRLDSRVPTMKTVAAETLSLMSAANTDTVHAVLPFLRGHLDADASLSILVYINSLAQNGIDAKTQAAVLPWINAKDKNSREVAIQYLVNNQCSDPAFLKTLFKLAKSKDPDEREMALMDLAKQKTWSKEIRAALLQGFQDSDKDVRLTTVELIQNNASLSSSPGLLDKDFLIALAETLKDPSQDVRATAAATLFMAKPRDPDIIQAIRRADPNFVFTWDYGK